MEKYELELNDAKRLSEVVHEFEAAKCLVPLTNALDNAECQLPDAWRDELPHIGGQLAAAADALAKARKVLGQLFKDLKELDGTTLDDLRAIWNENND